MILTHALEMSSWVKMVFAFLYVLHLGFGKDEIMLNEHFQGEILVLRKNGCT